LFDNFRRNSLRWAPLLARDQNVTQISGDVLDVSSLEEALRGVDTVIHLAAIAGVSSYYNESLLTLRVNILGTVNVLEAAVKNKVKRFIHFSTSEVFGPDALWVQETSPLAIGPVSDRRWVYATSKLAGEHFALRYAEEHHFGATVVRPFNIYGPRQAGEGAIGNFCRAAITGQSLTVYGEGSAIRAWCYVSDLVDGVATMLHTPDSAGQVFNLGNPREVETTLGLARRIAAIVPSVTIRMQDMERAEVRARVPSIDRARKMLGFEPKVDLEQGLRSTLEWFRQAGA
jgi:nucleoside-diphosphate-sugar epimerase